MRARLTGRQIWTAPALLGWLSALGLTAALFSESTGDVIAWAALSAPVGAVLWHTWRPPDE